MTTIENSTATHRVTDVTDHFVIAVTRACARAGTLYKQSVTSVTRVTTAFVAPAFIALTGLDPRKGAHL